MYNCLMEKIIKNNDKEGMKKLNYSFTKAMEFVKEHDKEKYDEIEMCLYEGAYGKVLSQEMAHKIIMNMKPYGCKWNIEQTKEVQNQYSMHDIRDVDFWIVMNSAYNDYHNMFEEDVEKYAMYTKDFIKDPDAKEGKVFTYFTKIVE